MMTSRGKTCEWGQDECFLRKGLFFFIFVFNNSIKNLMKAPYLEANFSLASSSQLVEISHSMHESVETLKEQLDQAMQFLFNKRYEQFGSRINVLQWKMAINQLATTNLDWMIVDCLTLYYLLLYHCQHPTTSHFREGLPLIDKFVSKAEKVLSLRPNNLRIKLMSVNVLLFGCSADEFEHRYQEAYQKAMLAYEHMIEIFKYIEQEHTHELINGHPGIKDQIYFSQILLKKSLPIVEALSSLGKVEDSWESVDLLEVKAIITPWKLNPEHNIHELHHKFGLKHQENRNILGIKDTQHQRQKSIEQILKPKRITHQQLNRTNDLLYEISQKSLNRKLEYLVVAMNFLGRAHFHLDRIRNDSLPFVVRNHNKKTEYFYLKAIETAMKYLPNKSLVHSLILEYQNKFHYPLNPISEENTLVNSSKLALVELRKSPKKKARSREQRKKKIEDLSPFAWKRSQSTLDVPRKTQSKPKKSRKSRKTK